MNEEQFGNPYNGKIMDSNNVKGSLNQEIGYAKIEEVMTNVGSSNQDLTTSL